MAKNLRKGSKVLVSVSGKGFKTTPGVVTKATEDFIDIRVSSGVALGKILMRKPSEVKRSKK